MTIAAIVLFSAAKPSTTLLTCSANVVGASEVLQSVITDRRLSGTRSVMLRYPPYEPPCENVVRP